MTTATLARPRYIPEGSKPVTMEGADGVAYVHDTAGGFYAIGYRGRAGRSAFNYRFRTAAQRDAYVADFLASVKAAGERKAAAKAEAQAFEHTLKVGAILVHSWGYEQTNIDFYEVTAAPSSKTVRVRPIGWDKDATQETGFMCGSCMPKPGAFLDREPETLKRVSHGNRVSMRHGSAYPWDGKPEHWSSYA